MPTEVKSEILVKRGAGDLDSTTYTSKSGSTIMYIPSPFYTKQWTTRAFRDHLDTSDSKAIFEIEKGKEPGILITDLRTGFKTAVHTVGFASTRREFVGPDGATYGWKGNQGLKLNRYEKDGSKTCVGRYDDSFFSCLWTNKSGKLVVNDERQEFIDLVIIALFCVEEVSRRPNPDGRLDPL